jgi:SAM-dependent methyltransferase
MRVSIVFTLIRYAAEKLEWRLRQSLLRSQFNVQDLERMSKQFYENVPEVGGWAESDYRNFALKHVMQSSKQVASILDVGCGDGWALAHLDTLADKVGVDFSKSLLRKAKKRNPTIQTVLASVDYLPFKNSAFDLVMFLDVLEHVPKPENLFHEAKRVAKLCVVFTTDYEGILVPSPRYQLVDNTPKFKLIRSWKCQLTFFRMGKPTSLLKGLLFGTGLMGYSSLSRRKRAQKSKH